MPNPGKPIMGYPNRRAAVRALLDEGLGREDIAVRLGIAPDEVRSTLRDLREAGAVVPPPRTRGPTRVAKKAVTQDAPASPPSDGFGILHETSGRAVALGKMARAMSEVRYRLQRADGSYLHMTLVGADGELVFTRERAWSWLGYRHQHNAVLRAHPTARRLTPVRVMPEPKTDLFVGRVG